MTERRGSEAVATELVRALSPELGRIGDALKFAMGARVVLAAAAEASSLEDMRAKVRIALEALGEAWLRTPAELGGGAPAA